MPANSNIRRVIVQSFASDYLTMGVQFLASIAIARMLSPDEIGVFSVAAVMVQLASMVRDFGVGEYLIVEKEINNTKIRAAFTLNLMVSWMMGLLVFALRHPAAQYYKDPRIIEILSVTSLNFVIIPFGAITVAYFRRQLEYLPIIRATVLAAIVNAAVTTTLAYLGKSHMSLAWGSLSGVATTVLVMVLHRPAGFPRLPGFRGITHAARFGSQASIISVFRQLGRSAPDLVIGRAVDITAVGLYSRAAGILEILNSSVLLAAKRIALPFFSQENRETGSVSVAYAQATRYLIVLGWPFCAGVAILAHPLITVLYGDAWSSSAPLVQWLAAAFLLEILFFCAQDALLAAGQVSYGASLQIITQLVRLAFMLLASPFGLHAICASFIASSCVNGLIFWVSLRRLIGLSLSSLRSVIADGCVAATFTALPALTCYLVLAYFSHNPWLILVTSTVSGILGWLLALHIRKHPLIHEIRGATKRVLRNLR